MPDLLIDTDAGIDDLLAIAFLLTQPSFNIVAITVVNGLSHPDAGAANILRLLQLTNRLDIPVSIGAQHPLMGGTDFPAPWRKTADQLPGVDLPATTAKASHDAIDFLAGQFATPQPVPLLALGPHTNLAEALAQSKGVFSGIGPMTMMGGAVFVEGNVGGNDKSAEWNIYEDPRAAASVFGAGIPNAMVPLDATQYVPIRQSFLDEAAKFTSPLGKVVYQLLSLGYTSNDEDYYAWDPLAAVYLAAPSVLSTQPHGIEIVTLPPEIGRTKPVPAGENQVQIATTADPEIFRSTFLGAFS